jgi:hypothetical protein
MFGKTKLIALLCIVRLKEHILLNLLNILKLWKI